MNLERLKKKLGLHAFFSLPRFQKRIISVCSDLVGLSVSFWAAYALRLDQPTWFPDESQAVTALASFVVTILVFIKLGLYRAVIRYLGDKALLTIVYGIVISSLAVILFGYLFQAFVPRSVPIIYGVLAFLFVGGSRLSIRMLVRRPLKLLKEPVAIVGVGDTGLQLASALEQGGHFNPVVFVSLEKRHHRSLINGLPVIAIDNVEQQLASYKVQRVLLALDPDPTIDRKSLLAKLETVTVPVQTVPSVSEVIAGQAKISEIRDLEIEDLLGRDPVAPDSDLIAKSLQGKQVLVTGAGGSIGSELCRQVIRHRPKTLILLDHSEFALYAIDQELQAIIQNNFLDVEVHALLGSVTDRQRCQTVFKSYQVHTVYHAAAYKHVPLVEHNCVEGVRNNVFGTYFMAEAAIQAGVERFVLVSTDKAVRPTNVMGASKRVAELVLQGLAERDHDTVFSMVRFGNVLGSSGSVVPLFRRQIREGGPVTVTHPDVIRYFMTISEASQLVLQAGNMGQGGEVFVLDMGEPVNIASLARKMIHLMGLQEKSAQHPEGDVEVRYTGLRPGEKLYEELLIGDNPIGTTHPRIMMARERSLHWQGVEKLIEELEAACRAQDIPQLLRVLQNAPTDFIQRQPEPGLALQ
ncbi:nucleoside-diphosphate sugar epimerase/dehydratase [Marinobacter sp. CHS3-4]|uniref:nucleoside-diphosphate sugar epimerase/dehydratase n=1 Tax=Marinobacter sp. CHS3-4 TaxID=3045174 RepID=UPI0024B52A28|nr:nucleoside-diphosphate sugar epimerase/dehydratase [Marinobacter sp. CHS3-4]MDI9244985.1 nucleoside-diphosphate sugar epimerase/dehydratase [Marinobacter sp. CHS3-4]